MEVEWIKLVKERNQDIALEILDFLLFFKGKNKLLKLKKVFKISYTCISELNLIDYAYAIKAPSFNSHIGKLPFLN